MAILVSSVMGTSVVEEAGTGGDATAPCGVDGWGRDPPEVATDSVTTGTLRKPVTRASSSCSSVVVKRERVKAATPESERNAALSLRRLSGWSNCPRRSRLRP